MPARVWTPKVKGIPYTVVARWNILTFGGELVVDETVIRTWGTRTVGRDISFKIEGYSASLRRTLTAFDLYIDGQKIKYQ